MHFLYGVFIFLAAGSVATASCGSAECPLDLGQHTQIHRSTGRLGLQLAFEAIDQDSPFHGSDPVDFGQVLRPDHDEIKTRNRNLRLVADYEAGPRLALSLALPLVQRRHAHLAVAGHGGHDHEHGADDGADRLQQWDFTRWGDLSAWGRYRVLSSARTDLSLGLGLSLPIGSTGVRNNVGIRAEPSLQPGRGAWGLMVEAAYQYRPLIGGRQAKLFGSGFHRRNTSGRHGYTFGDEWTLHAGGQYAVAGPWTLLLQVVGRHTGRDAAGRSGELTGATGATSAYFSPGIQLEILSGVAFYSYYQIPFYRRVNSVQLTADSNFLLGLGYRLNIL
jgi:hypothetical protein